MRTSTWRFPLFLAAWLVFGLIGTGAVGQTSAFSYQGSLEAGGAAADGSFDLRFSVFAAETGGGALGTVERGGVAVDAGVFSVELDFGAVVFEAGADRWLEVAVRAAGGGDYTTLTPRTRIVGVPHATRAAVAGVADFALDGPFAPADDTPRDSSGAVGSTVSAELRLLVSGGVAEAVGVVFPVVLERPFQGFSGPQAPLLVESLEVWRAYVPGPAGAAWYNAFASQRSAELTITVLAPAPPGDTVYTFRDMGIAGYRVERGLDGGPIEVIGLRSVAGLLPTRENREPADLGALEPPLAGGPSLGFAGLAGPMTYSWPGATPGLTSAGVLPAETLVFSSGGGGFFAEAAPVWMLANVFANQGLWQDLVQDTNRTISLLNADGSIAWPRTGGPRLSKMVRWELRRAPDGGVYEAYKMEVGNQ